MAKITLKGKGKLGDKDTLRATFRVLDYPYPMTRLIYPCTRRKPLADVGHIARDVGVLGMLPAKLVMVEVNFHNARHAGKMVNRSHDILKYIGCLGPVLDWERQGGRVLYATMGMTGADAMPMVYVLSRLAVRARRGRMADFRRLDMYHLRLVTGLVEGAKGRDRMAVLADEWIMARYKTRKRAEVEEVKKRRAEGRQAGVAIKRVARVARGVDVALGEGVGGK